LGWSLFPCTRGSRAARCWRCANATYLAARAIGVSPTRIAIAHAAQYGQRPDRAGDLTTAFAILQEAVPSFLGLPQPPTASWGQDINYNQRFTQPDVVDEHGAWHGHLHRRVRVQFLGDALRDWLDPQLVAAPERCPS
jgi:ABC-type dipeptide/oligopeptide/nickel transport system permease subunit